MRFVLAIVIIVLVIVIIAAIVIAVAVFMQRRSSRRAAEVSGTPTRSSVAGATILGRPGAWNGWLTTGAPPPRRAGIWTAWCAIAVRPSCLRRTGCPCWAGSTRGRSSRFFCARRSSRSRQNFGQSTFRRPCPLHLLFAPGTPRARRRRRNPVAPQTLAARLTELDNAGDYPELLRLLDRRMPPWPVGGSLIEVAREIVELERNVATARTSSVPEAVTSRLEAESRTAAGALWDLADRVVAAASYGIETERMSDHLERENAKLVELRAAIREARTGLAELTLSGGGRSGDVDRAERRFRALAATAAELQEMDGI